MVLLALFLAVIISVVLAFCLPTWASACIMFAAVLAVAIGGGALLAKAAMAGAVVVLVAWLWKRHLRRQAIQRMRDFKLVAIPEVRTKDPQASQRRTQRQAA
jgi:hypothetical protein